MKNPVSPDMAGRGANLYPGWIPESRPEFVLVEPEASVDITTTLSPVTQALYSPHPPRFPFDGLVTLPENQVAPGHVTHVGIFFADVQ